MTKIGLELEGNRIRLRKFRISDANSIYKNISRKVVKWTTNIPWPYRKQYAIKFIRRSNYRIKNKKEFVFGIVLKEENKVIGCIGLHKVNWKNKNAEIGYWLGKKYWGKGLTTEAVNLILKFTFENLRLHRVYATIFEENIASKRVLEKNGFKLEGISREVSFRYGKWHNKLRFGVLRKEYKELCA
jgi:RimJ/RimL family protein N-acetyltransferase